MSKQSKIPGDAADEALARMLESAQGMPGVMDVMDVMDRYAGESETAAAAYDEVVASSIFFTANNTTEG